MDLVTLLCAALVGSVSPSETPASSSGDFRKRGCCQHLVASPSALLSSRHRGLPPATGTRLMGRTPLSQSACVASSSNSCYFSVGFFLFYFILASFEITVVSGVALRSCPMGGEGGDQVPAVFCLNSCASPARVCSLLLSPPRFAAHPSC